MPDVSDRGKMAARGPGDYAAAEMTPIAQTLELRPALSADRDVIAAIWHEGASLPTVGPVPMPSLATMRQWIDDEIEAGWEITVAVRGAEIVGFLAIQPHEAFLDELFLRPGEIGGGVGRALFAHAVTAMPDGFTLFTRPGNARARRFYEKAGMVLLREDKHPRSGDPIVYYGWKRD